MKFDEDKAAFVINRLVKKQPLIDAKQFDMGSWGASGVDCGTTHCALGWVLEDHDACRYLDLAVIKVGREPTNGLCHYSSQEELNGNNQTYLNNLFGSEKFGNCFFPEYYKGYSKTDDEGNIRGTITIEMVLTKMVNAYDDEGGDLEKLGLDTEVA